MLLADLRQGRIIDDQELKEGYAARQPYGEWLDTNLLRLADLPIPNQRVERHSREELSRLQKAFGYTYEDVNDTILPMARTGAEPTAAMGVDIPLAVLDNRDRPLFSYFKQLFAQVTNPPMDAIREEIVTDTTVYAADDGNLLQEQPDNCGVLQIHNPVLTSTDLMKIKAMNRPGFHAATVSLLYYKAPTWIWYWTGWRWRWTGRTGRGQHCHPFRPGGGREPRGHPLSAGGVCHGAAPGSHREAHRRIYPPGIR